MFLDAVEHGAGAAFDHSNSNCSGIFNTWQQWQPSAISHHGTACCEIAREWIAATDFALLYGGSKLAGPRWLRQRFDWGPGTYPIAWCEVLKRKKLDCGVHAALAHEVFTRRGVKSFRVQLVQEFSSDAASQWHSAWTSDKAVTDWIRGEYIYHEGCAVVIGDKGLKLWDSSAGSWIDPKNTKGYGSVRAVRIASIVTSNGLHWGAHSITTNTWIELNGSVI
jgi:hypothetical protein